MYNTLVLVTNNKMRYAQTIYTMIDPYTRTIYPETPELPHIQMHNPENIDNIIQLSLVLTKLNEKYFIRALSFVSVITFVTAIPFLYILLQN